MLGDHCEDLNPYYANQLCGAADRRYRFHLAGCKRCQVALLTKLLMEEFTPTLADRVRKVLSTCIDTAEPVRQLAPIALGALVVALVPGAWEGVRWQQRATWSVRW